MKRQDIGDDGWFECDRAVVVPAMLTELRRACGIVAPHGRGGIQCLQEAVVGVMSREQVVVCVPAVLFPSLPLSTMHVPSSVLIGRVRIHPPTYPFTVIV